MNKNRPEGWFLRLSARRDVDEKFRVNRCKERDDMTNW